MPKPLMPARQSARSPIASVARLACRMRSELTSNACASDILRANLIDLPSRSAPKVSYARLILVILICMCPFILLAGWSHRSRPCCRARGRRHCVS